MNGIVFSLWFKHHTWCAWTPTGPPPGCGGYAPAAVQVPQPAILKALGTRTSSFISNNIIDNLLFIWNYIQTNFTWIPIQFTEFRKELDIQLRVFLIKMKSIGFYHLIDLIFWHWRSFNFTLILVKKGLIPLFLQLIGTTSLRQLNENIFGKHFYFWMPFLWTNTTTSILMYFVWAYFLFCS